MSEKISDLIKGVDKDPSLNQEQKNKAKKVLELLNAKNKGNLTVSVGTRQAILGLLTETTLDVNISAEAIEDNLSSEPTSGNLDLGSQDATDEPSQETEDGEIDTEAENFAEQLSRQGWDEARIVAKMISLGYIPAVHSMKYNGTFRGHKIRWVWDNSRYAILGGPLTNGKVNGGFEAAQRSWAEGVLKKFTAEKDQLKILLNQIKVGDATGDRSQIDERIEALDKLNKALTSRNKADVKAAALEYNAISEKTGNIKDLYKKYGVKEKVTAQRNKDGQAAYDAKEKEIKADRQAVLDEIDRKVKTIETDRQASVDTESARKDKLTQDLDALDDEKTVLKGDKENLETERARLDSERISLETERNRLDSERQGLDTDRTRLYGEKQSLEIKRDGFESEKVDLGNAKTKLEGELTGLQDELKILNETKPKTKEVKSDIVIKEKDIKAKLREIDVKEAEIKAKQRQIDAENTRITAKGGEITAKEGEIATKKGQITAKEGEIAAKKGEIATKEGEIATKKGQITAKEGEIATKNRQIRDYKPLNTADLAKHDYERTFLLDLKSAVDAGDHKKASELLRQYKIKNSADFRFDSSFSIPSTRGSSTPISPENFVVTDQSKELEKARKTGRGDATRQNELMQKEVASMSKAEVARVNAEVKIIEAEITRIRKEAEKQAKKLDKVAKEHPEKIPELKAEIEKTVGDYNVQIAALEKAGVENLQKLCPDDLKLLETKSPWTKKIVEVNDGIDNILGKKAYGVGGKFVGISSMILLGKGLRDANTGLNQETALNVADIALGVIPILGGIYDIGMAIRGEDLNGVEMSSGERLTRAGLGVLGLIPMVGTAIKGAALTAKSVNTVTKVSRAGEMIYHGGNLTGKVVSLLYLGYGGFTTATYMLPSND